MRRGHRYEREVEAALEQSGINFNKQVKYTTSFGRYMADFVYDDIIIESTNSNLDKSKGIKFIDRKINKLNELTNQHTVIIVTTSPETWKREVPGAICTTLDNLPEIL